MNTHQGTTLTTEPLFAQATFPNGIRASTAEPITTPAVVPLTPAEPFSPPDPTSVPERAKPCSAPAPVETKPLETKPQVTPAPERAPAQVPLPQYEEPRRGCGSHHY